MSEFQKELTKLINCHSIENESNTPDFLLALYLMDCLVAYSNVTLARDKWYGKEHGSQSMEGEGIAHVDTSRD